MNFKDLQESWQAQSVKTLIDPYKLSEQKNRWQIRQRKLLRSNVIMSLGFMAAMIEMAWVYISYNQEFGWTFKVSLGAIFVLMIIIAIIAWKSYAFKKENLEVSSDHFISYQIRKLNWQRNMLTKYIWIYTVLIWLALVMYTLGTTSSGTLTFRLTALAIITAYIFGITWWIRIKKHKKQLLELNSLTADLENMKEKLLGN